MQSSNTRTLVRFAGISFSAERSAIVGSIFLWLVLTMLGFLLLKYSLPKAIIMGFAALILHWVAEMLHQAGHALAARSTGHPIVGIRLWGVLSSTLYPPDEPILPKSTHMRRALGGPLMSFVVSILAAILLLLLRNGSWEWWLGLFFLLDNFLVFTIGAFLPLGFTDGSTLLSLNSTKG